MFEILLALILSYLLGSVPTAILAGKILRNIDIRQHGSGNAGATNVFRILGWKAGIVVLIIDMLKGFIAVWLIVDIISFVPEERIYYELMVGVAAITGHIWTVFAGFRGGKGVGTAAGVFLGLQPGPVIICLLVFIGVVVKTRYVSLGSMIGSLLLPIILIIQYFFLNIKVPLPMIFISILLAILILVTHRENITRLLQGTENRISLNKNKEGT